MEILEKKQNLYLENDIKNIMFNLKYKNYPILLLGSASLKSQQYIGDYDLFTDIKKEDTKEAFDEFEKIFKRTINDKNHFIEIKIQQQNGDKKKIFKLQDFNYNKFKKKYNSNIDFVKIDLVCLVENVFKEVSCIYKILDDKVNILQNIVKEILELKKDCKFYKALKRTFSYLALKQQKTKEDLENIKKLSKIFNSELGKKYSKLSNIQALLLLLDNTDNKAIIKNIRDRLIDYTGTININEILKQVDEMTCEINNEAKKYTFNLE